MHAGYYTRRCGNEGGGWGLEGEAQQPSPPPPRPDCWWHVRGRGLLEAAAARGPGASLGGHRAGAHGGWLHRLNERGESVSP